ncbi:uncharacterized protein BDZ83DRAFT_578573 [Colletotrichum acutatum]|uniref:Uncharacterized protein n=1 Tax=Glomerella acutata TaxID=27357 RepID=A0AAD8UKK0_GLOAC|nr:uncharacterized protein BDZ83DRAFT_578573 [Colletotrichum acutatum]KAK1724507.1 hypothetical protein BDZ83DRAFT_578573 [Colletotrichum acutatum]
MAEVLGVVLKKLWDQVHDTPSEIGQLVAQVELLNAVLAEADAMSDQVYSTNNNPSVISLNYCQHAVNHLETLVTDLQQQMTMANKPRRSIARLKFTLKKDLIQNCQNKLQVALQMVVLSQNTRILPHSILSGVQGRYFFCPIYRARVRPPMWMSERIWDIQTYRACAGWKFSLRTWTVRPFSAPVFGYVKSGSWSQVLQEFEGNRASVFDRDSEGWSLVHVCGPHMRRTAL